MTVTRFAPSPTGYIHVGNLRTALFNWLIARKQGGTFILRLDDTDPERSKQEYADAIQEDLEWLGLTWDRIERQSDRMDRYAAAADELREKARFYEAFETPTELDLKRKKQLNMGRPPVYDRAALALSDDDKAKLRAERGDGHDPRRLHRRRGLHLVRLALPERGRRRGGEWLRRQFGLQQDDHGAGWEGRLPHLLLHRPRNAPYRLRELGLRHGHADASDLAKALYGR